MKSILRIFLITCLALVISTVAIFIIQPRIPLAPLATLVSYVWNRVSENELSIRGNYYFIPGEWGRVTIRDGSFEITGERGLKIKAAVARAETKFHIPSLFLKDVLFDGILMDTASFDYQPPTKPVENEHLTDSALPSFPGFLRQTGIIDLKKLSGRFTTDDSENHMEMYLESVTGILSRHDSGRVNVQGTFNGQDLNVDLDVGPLINLNSDEVVEFSTRLTHKSIAADIAGRFGYGKSGPDITADFSISGDYFDDLMSLVGRQGSKDKSFRFTGRTNIQSNEQHIEVDTFIPGARNVNVTIRRNVVDTVEPLISVQLHGDVLNLDTVLAYIAGDTEGTQVEKQAAVEEEKTLDRVLFPEAMTIQEMVLNVDIEKLVVSGSTIKTLKMEAVVENGAISKAPFSALFDNSSVQGDFSLDLSGENPQVSAQINVRPWEIGNMLEKLDIAEGIKLDGEDVSLLFSTSGWSLRELLYRLEFTCSASDGRYSFSDPNTGYSVSVNIEKLVITGVPGGEITTTIDGKINKSPISILLQIDDHRDQPPHSVSEISAVMEISQGETQWVLEGIIPLPFHLQGLVLHSNLTGEKLSDIKNLVHLKLPDIGPYRLGGTLEFVPEGYKLSRIAAELGASSVTGNIMLNMKTAPPELLLDLKAPLIQLNDFRSDKPGLEESSSQEKEIQRVGVDSDLQSLTDQSVIDTYNAGISIEVKNVLSGIDYLGSGRISIEQEDGRLMFNPLEISLPQGTVMFGYSHEPYGENRLYVVDIEISDFDYGVVGRWYDPETDVDGVLTARSYLKGVSPDFKRFMSNASGTIDFSMKPYQMRSGVIDLWAMNLLGFLAPIFTSGNESKVNCAAGRFNMEDGILKHEKMLIDTSRVQVKGTVEVDFRKEWINAVFRPIPKRPQFFSLATPIQVSGALADINVGIAKGGLIGTVVRFVTSYIVVPLQWVILEKVPEDGTEECIELVKERVDDRSQPE